MSKAFTQIPLEQFDQVKPDTLNKNMDRYLGEYNGRLDGNNLPVKSVQQDHLLLPAKDPNFTDLAGGVDQLSSKMPTQAYYSTRRYGWDNSSDVWTPLTSIDLDTESWKRGFNSVRELSGWSQFPLNIVAQEGMLVGCATIDWEHGTNVFNVTIVDDPPTSGPRARGFDWWTEWGVFVNDILVARSGRIYPRRHTTQIPFSIPVGSQAVEVDIRFIVNTNRAVGAPSLDTVSTDFNIFGAEIWCRNHYR